MEDLRRKYEGLLEIMREGFTQEDGSELTFNSEEFVGRITALLCEWNNGGIVEEDEFEEVLGDDWTWEHYGKVAEELQRLGAVTEDGILVEPECDEIIKELHMLLGDNFYV